MLRRNSIARKIVFASVAPVVLATATILGIVSVFEWRLSQQALLETARTRAMIIAANSTPSLAFGDKEDASEILKTLSADPQVTSAVIYDLEGNRFAAYLPANAASAHELGTTLPDSRKFGAQILALYEPVMQGDLRLGTLYLQFDLDQLHRRIWAFVLTGAIVGAGASGLALALVVYMQRSISGPILELAEVARSVSAAKSYGIRAGKATGAYAEVDWLTDSFNGMLDRIESQDANLRESELQFRRAISDAPIPIAIHYQDGGILELSRGWLESSGDEVGSVPNLIGWFRERTDAGERFCAAIAEPRASGDTVDLGEIEVGARDGGVRFWEANATPIGHFQDGKATWLLIAVDATESIQDRQALERRSRELERSNQELDDFAYIASHDMKEPLRGLNNNARFLDEDFGETLGEEGRRRTSRMQFLCKRLERLIDDLLYYSRIGRQELAIQKVDLNRTVADIGQMIEASTEGKTAKIVLASFLPSCVCDIVCVQEIFRNLIVNAIKYNQSPEKIVEVGFLSEHAGLRDVYYVRDNGYGIAPEFHREVFRIFKRLNPENDDVKGTGSGLTFVKKFVERHRGTVWVESRLGAGSTFYFTLTNEPQQRKTTAINS